PDRDVPHTIVEDGAPIGANATLLCGIRVGRRAMVAAGAVVTKDVLPRSRVARVPARAVGWVCECGRPLDAKMRCADDGKAFPELRPKRTAGSRSRKRATNFH